MIYKLRSATKPNFQSIQVPGGFLRVTLDGTTPTPTHGLLVGDGEEIDVEYDEPEPSDPWERAIMDAVRRLG